MPNVIREIHIDAPPDVVRRHVIDPDERRIWLDDDATEVNPAEGGVIVLPSGHGDGQVLIEIAPDGEGTRVRVTEDVQLPGTGMAPVRPMRPVGDRETGRPTDQPAEPPTGDPPVALAA